MKTFALILSLASMAAGASWRASLVQAQQLQEAGQAAAAERVYQNILAASGDLEPDDLNSLAVEFFYLARYPDAETLYRRALAGWNRRGPEVAGNRAITEGNLGTLLKVEGRYAEAEPLFLSWLHQAEGAAGPDSVVAGRAANGLAALYLSWGRLDKAESSAVRAHAIFAARPEFESPARVDNVRTLASIWLEKGLNAEADALLRPLLKTLPDRAAVGVYDDLTTAEIRQNHLSEAETLARSALELARRALPAEHPLVAVTLNNLGQVERFQGRYLEAEQDYREAVRIWQAALGPKHPDVGRGLMNLAAFYHERGREAGAEDLYRQAAAIFDAGYGKEHPLTLVARNELGEVLRAEHRFSESEKLSQATLDPLVRRLGGQDRRVARALENYARLLDDTRRAPQAAVIRGRIQNTAQGFVGPNR